MTNSFFIAADTKPGKSKISSLLKSLGFIERTSTPLWSYTYTRLRVDQVDFRDDYYEDSDWRYDTDFETKWGVRVSLHQTHKPHHKSLYQALTLIISQIYESEELFINADGQDVPGASIEPNLVLDWESVVLATKAQVTELKVSTDEGDESRVSESDEWLAMGGSPVDPSQAEQQVKSRQFNDLPTEEENTTYEDDIPHSIPTLVQVEAEDDDDWGDDDDWDDDDDDDDDDEDAWATDDSEEDSDGEDGNFDGIVTWD